MYLKFLCAAMLVLGPAAVAAQDTTAVAGDSAAASLESLRAMTVWEAEQAFARDAAELGTRAAFLAHLADDAVVFTPRATNGLEAYGALPETTDLLQWEPVFAETSEGDDLGYTTGPYTYRTAPDAPVSGTGRYFSIWQRKADGVWKVVLDMGTSTAETPESGRTIELPSRSPAPPSSASERRNNLLRLEQLLTTAAARSTARRALLHAVDVDARHNNGGTLVRGGRAAANSAPDGPVAYERLGYGFSEAADMAYSYGEYTLGGRRAPEPDGNWVRVWRMQSDGVWRIVFMVTAPFAQQP